MAIQTPADQFITTKVNGGSMKGVLHFRPNWGSEQSALFKKAQSFVDSEVLRRCAPLVPHMYGTLVDAGTNSTVIGSGEVVYRIPHARYQYYGKVMIGSAPKQETDIDLKYNGAPQRGAFWFERMKKTDKDEILRGAGEILGGW